MSSHHTAKDEIFLCPGWTSFEFFLQLPNAMLLEFLNGKAGNGNIAAALLRFRLCLDIASLPVQFGRHVREDTAHLERSRRKMNILPFQRLYIGLVQETHL